MCSDLNAEAWLNGSASALVVEQGELIFQWLREKKMETSSDHPSASQNQFIFTGFRRFSQQHNIAAYHCFIWLPGPRPDGLLVGTRRSERGLKERIGSVGVVPCLEEAKHHEGQPSAAH